MEAVGAREATLAFNLRKSIASFHRDVVSHVKEATNEQPCYNPELIAAGILIVRAVHILEKASRLLYRLR